MHHEMLTQRTFFAITRRYAESAFYDAWRTSSGPLSRPKETRYDMHHEILTQRTFFAITCNTKRYVESAFCDACRTSSELDHLVSGIGGGGGGVGVTGNLCCVMYNSPHTHASPLSYCTAHVPLLDTPRTGQT